MVRDPGVLRANMKTLFPVPLRLVSLVLALIGAFALCLPGQVTNGSIAGQVTDATGSVVQNATLHLVDKGTGTDRVTHSDTNGNYTFPLVAPGVYSMKAEATGFQSLGVSNLEVQVAQAVNQGFPLSVGTSATTVEVKATTPVLEQRNADIGQVISPREVVQLPLNGRNYFDLAKLAPGVTELGTGGSQSTGLAINGQRANQISFFFDGVDTRTETSGRPAFTPSIEAIQEFKVQENNFAAEYGRNPSAINLSSSLGKTSFTAVFLNSCVTTCWTLAAFSPHVSTPYGEISSERL